MFGRRSLGNHLPDWRLIGELLQANEYEGLAEFLQRAQATFEDDADPLLLHVLALASRLCLACDQSHAEVEWHEQACEMAAEREEKLRHELATVLDLVCEHDLSVVPGEWRAARPPPLMHGLHAPDQAEAAGFPSLWRRIQVALQRRLGRPALSRVVPDVLAQGPTPPTPGRAEGTAFSPPEEAEAPQSPLAQIAQAQPPTSLQETAEEDSSLAQGGPAADTAPPAGSERPREPAPPSLVVYCLGSFRVFQDDLLITDWDSLRAKCILKYLIAHHGTPIVKDILMDVFWKDAEPEAARRNLHQAVYSLRKTLRQKRPDFPYIWFEDDRYLLNPDTSVWLDFEQFEKHVRDGQSLEAAGSLPQAILKYGIAEGLYQGNFLEEDLYEDWPAPQRQHLQTLYIEMANRLTEYYVQHGDPGVAIVLCRKILSFDSCCEEAHRRLMECYLAQGQRHLAVRQFEACAQALEEELGLTPAEETVELYCRITTGR